MLFWHFINTRFQYVDQWVVQISIRPLVAMVSLPDSWDFGDDDCSFRPCLQPTARLRQHTPPFKASLLSSKCKCRFLSVGKSMRLWPITFIYFLLFLFFDEQSLVLLCNPGWSQASGIPLASTSSAIPGVIHHKYFTIACIFPSFQFIFSHLLLFHLHLLVLYL